MPLPEQRQAELALYRRRPEQAESILLAAQPPLVWRAIEMNLRYAIAHTVHTWAHLCVYACVYADDGVRWTSLLCFWNLSYGV